MDIVYLKDTREQAPYVFKGYNSEFIGLKTGDYSVRVDGLDLSNEIVVERKSQSDFIGSITQGRSRFEQECIRGAVELNKFYIVVEARWKDIFEGNYRSKIKPNSVINTILGWQIKYGINIILAGDRKKAESITKRLLDLYIKYKYKDKFFK
jgi:ERCC4-type nuclease